MAFRSLCLLVAVLPLLAASACSSPVSQGIRTFNAGAHPQALAHFLETERDVIHEPPETRAKYALYRGLTHLSLGDDESAERWLAEAKAWLDRERSVFEADDRGRLKAAWAALGHAPGTWGAAVLATR